MKSILFLTALCTATNMLFAQNEKFLDPSTCPFQFGAPTTITKKGDSFNHPRISPDGTKVIVTKTYTGVYVIDLKNTTPVQTITTEHMAGFDAKWSKDGSEIRFKECAKQKNGKTTKELLKYNIMSKLVSNDNISYSKTDNTSKPREITVSLNIKRSMVEASDGTRTWDITKTPKVYYSYVISPDQSKVLIHENGKMYVYAMDGSGMLCCLGNGHGQSWSPDGRYLVYFLGVSDGNVIIDSDIYICSSDGSKRWKMTNTPDKIEMWPNWSPQGDMIIYDEDKSETIEFVRVIQK
ncbi:MAG: PD40 domain-containing protein [Bacteroidales bacterium]|nr:PD40 domain-containing protein [Bacteroidales bacterium]